MTMSQEACRHFLVFFSSVENDNEPRGLLSSLGFFFLGAKDDNELGGSLMFLGLFLQVQKMITSRDPSLSSSLVVLLQL
jgi:hypothetical protein